jgi:hypothetical protein
MPFPLLAAIPALLGGIGGAGGLLGALGGAGGIMGMIGKILPFGDMLGGIMKSLSPDKQADTDTKQAQAKQDGAKAQADSDDFIKRMADGAAAVVKPFPLLNLFG